ncbi:MAG: hypothetical protein PHH54_07270 [Candidatus Nanoarchaeia archaeon]|nr:hypothetical protein [Candidatus Nanoarchaeia archaeon]MDD5741756.1 hypothetical protein [Candidatus Nanoarchaeia archaeon]
MIAIKNDLQSHDLDIKLYIEDGEILLNQGVLKTITYTSPYYFIRIQANDTEEDFKRNPDCNVKIKEYSLKQLKFPFNTKNFYLDGYHDEPEIIALLGWDITLRKSRLIENIQETIKNPNTEDVPFWRRGFPGGNHFDRMHINYWHLSGENISNHYDLSQIISRSFVYYNYLGLDL